MMYRPINQLNLKLFTSITMHGNVNESIDSDEAAFYALSNYDTTGGYYNHAMTDSSSGFGNSGYLPSAWNSMMYLSQKHLQTTVQTGIKATFDVLTARKHKLTFSAGYTYEFIHNNGVSTQMYSFSDSSGVTVNTDSNGKKTYTYNGITYSSFTELYEVAKDALDTVTESQYENWVNQLYDSINHYITFSVKYSY